MKHQPLVPFILTISSWIGNITLTALAFYLAFTSSSPLTPLTFFTVAFCILLGNALPISVYLIELWWKQAELRAEGREADLTLRSALIKAEGLTERLEETQSVASKALLIGNQIPEKIKEKLKSLETLLSNLENGNLEEALLRLEKITTQDSEEISKELVAIKAKLESSEAELSDFKKQIDKGIKELIKTNESNDADALLKPITEKLERFHSQVQSLVLESAAATDKEFQSDDETDEEWKDEEFEDEDPVIEEQIQEDESSSDSEVIEFSGKDDVDSDATSSRRENVASKEKNEETEIEEPESLNDNPFPVEEIDEKIEGEEGATTEKESSAEAEDLNVNNEISSEIEPQSELLMEGEKNSKTGNETAVQVHAIIGIANKLFIRGDEPYLNWEKGELLQLVGIGEYEWKPSKPLQKPIEVKILLNDKEWSEGENLSLEPGSVLKVKPVFPQ